MPADRVALYTYFKLWVSIILIFHQQSADSPSSKRCDFPKVADVVIIQLDFERLPRLFENLVEIDGVQLVKDS